jgi:hypothetical protein
MAEFAVSHVVPMQNNNKKNRPDAWLKNSLPDNSEQPQRLARAGKQNSGTQSEDATDRWNQCDQIGRICAVWAIVYY